MNNTYSKNKHCKCGKLITNNSKQCKSCFVKWQHKAGILNVKGKNNSFYGVHKFGKNAPNWKGGLPKCKICNNKVKSYGQIYCSCKCFGLDYKGSNHPNYKEETIRNKKYYCSCGQEIKFQSAIYGGGNCYRCSNKKTAINRNLKGRNNPHFGKPASHSKWIRYNSILMRSSWEVAFAKWCDKQSIKWQYEPKTFILDETTYTPDFYLSEFNLWIEVKGFWRDNAKEKFELFKQKYCGERIKILDKQELKKLGII